MKALEDNLIILSIKKPPDILNLYIGVIDIEFNFQFRWNTVQITKIIAHNNSKNLILIEFSG